MNRIVKGDLIADVLHAAERGRADIWLSLPAMDETLAGDDDDYIRRVAGLYLRLFDSGRFRLSEGFKEVLEKELRGSLDSTPMASKDVRRARRQAMEQLVVAPHPTASLLELRLRMEQMKRPWKLEDRQLGAAIRDRWRMTPREIGAELDRLSPEKIPPWLFELVAPRVLQRSDLPVAIMRERPERYRCLLAWSGLLLLWSAAIAVPPDLRTQHAIFKDLWTDPNDFVDAHIAAEAAYGDVLVTTDSGQAARCELLRERKLVFFRSMIVEEFLQECRAPPRRFSP